MSDLAVVWGGLGRILGALMLPLAAIIISRWQQMDLEKDMLVAIVRAFVQLTIIGFALSFIFAAEAPIWIVLVITVMVLIAGHTAGGRAKLVPKSRLVATASISVATVLTVGLLVLLQVFPLEARYVIPIAGMVVGNSMNVTTLTMMRFRGDLKQQRPQVEAALALGATPRQSVTKQIRDALATGMTPIINSTKTVGLISLPGAMTGMILAGASPLEAVQIQAVVMYMLMGAAAFSGLTATFLSQPRFFTKSYQLETTALID
jgi:putative ABC transport system permease protein